MGPRFNGEIVFGQIVYIRTFTTWDLAKPC